MNLIIGKNSNIIKSIADDLQGHHIVSHREIDRINIAKYQHIFVFSWSHTDLNQNLILLEKLDLKKVIFVSTIAVMSLLKRNQWSRYPVDKAICEKKVLREVVKLKM